MAKFIKLTECLFLVTDPDEKIAEIPLFVNVDKLYYIRQEGDMSAIYFEPFDIDKDCIFVAEPPEQILAMIDEISNLKSGH